MLRRSNKGKNQSTEPITNRVTPAEAVYQQTPAPPADSAVSSDTMSREELMAQNAEARKMFEDLRRLRQSVEGLKQAGSTQATPSAMQTGEQIYLKETDEIIAAKQAILEQAKRDAEEQRVKREEMLRKEREAQQEQQRIVEAQRRAARMAEEAERKRLQAIEADRVAKEFSRKKDLEAMKAERQAREEQARRQEEAEAAARAEAERARAEALRKEGKAYASPEEMAAFFDEKITAMKQTAELENVKQELIYAQMEQGAMLGKMSQSTDLRAEKLAREQQQRLNQQQQLIKDEQDKLAKMLEHMKAQRLESVERDRAARELRKQKNLVDKLIREQNAHAARAERAARLKAEQEEREAKAKAEREERKARIKKKREERLRRAKERELIKKARRDAAARARLERKMLVEKSQADAELGGGIVNVQGVTINTAIKEIPQFSWRDLFGFKGKAEKKADTEQEKLELQEEREKRKEEARAFVDNSFQQRLLSYQQSTFGKKFNAFKAFCDRHKAKLLTGFSVILMVLVGTAGVFNYYTAYAYSYNGQTLGVVKNKDDVLRITDLLQGALTEDKDVDVIIDARDDIEFERVAATGDVKIDTSEDVLKRLTYMGDLNVEAYCIFVDGKKVGAVENKGVAEEVFRTIESMYTSDIEQSKVEKIEIIEKWEAREANISLEKVYSQEEMVDVLCTSGEKESRHEVKIGETLADICKLYSMTEEEILEANPNVDPKKLNVGSTLIIKQHAPILTVRITEKVTYEKEIPYEVQQTESPDIYQGYTELQQQGENGLSEITSRITLVNGEQIEEKPLVTTVKKEPVAEITLVGVKERPPSVGSGKYIWPIRGSYSFSSKFGYRWGRLHAGIDLSCSPGTDILAADGGVVTYSGYSGAYGYLIKIDHQNGMESRYAHNSKLLVSEGEKVFQGQHIAESGNTGRSTGPHLHFEIRVSGNPKNPMNYLP